MKQRLHTYPDTVADELVDQVQLMAALKLFELGAITSGKAAELAGIPRVEFLEECGRYRVPIYNPPADEAEEELRRDVSASAQARMP